MTSSPLSPVRGGTYFLTWTTYGSWLPGDPRGFVGRVPTMDGHEVHNQPGSAFDADMPTLTLAARDRLKGEKVVMHHGHAACCRDAFQEVADRSDFLLHACAIMATHVHLVVRSEAHDGVDLLRHFKGVSSRRLTQVFGKPAGESWWTRHGSRRLLLDVASREGALQYTLAQEHPLVLFGRNVPASE